MQLILNNQYNRIPPPTNASSYTYTMFSLKREDDITLKFNISDLDNKTEAGFAYLCPYVPPFIDEINLMCKTKISIKSGLEYTIHYEDPNHFTGRNYLVIHDNDVENYDIKVKASINRHIDLGQLVEYKMDGSSPLYLVSHLQKMTTGKS